jgi:hypothetical protein
MLAAGATLSSFAPKSTFAETDNVHDGFWWLEQSTVAKFGYISGYLDASDQALGIIPALSQAAKIPQTTEFSKLLTTNLDFSNIAYGQFIEGLDKFFGDFRNKRIQVRDAISYVRSEVRGVDNKTLERNLSILRKSASSPTSN